MQTARSHGNDSHGMVCRKTPSFIQHTTSRRAGALTILFARPRRLPPAQTCLEQQPLQVRALDQKSLGPLSIGDIHAAELAAPGATTPLSEPAPLARFCPPSQHPLQWKINDLLLRILLLHARSSWVSELCPQSFLALLKSEGGVNRPHNGLQLQRLQGRCSRSDIAASQL